MNQPDVPLNSPLYAALVALVAAALDGLTVFGVYPLTAEEKAIVLTIFTSAFAVAMLLVPIFQHANARMLTRLRSADPAVRSAEARRL